MFPVQPFEEKSYRPPCVVCKESVKLEECKADEHGQAVHEECYVSGLMEKIFEPGKKHAPRHRSDSSHITEKVRAAASWQKAGPLTSKEC